ncbi:MAG: asparagine synthase (glutamine-hydrolyzing) [Deltaproteobacteria bacterium RBG_13_49_15]|nr:MAG: asparagine synthase (glutamine-hydrolyzing) [Deltaproteobacteria bacterium RBG_13_49_15]
MFMCGIAGYIDFRGKFNKKGLEDASEMMLHRGPDGKGSFYEASTGIIHRRLAIIDLEGGVQPMYNEDRSLVVVFNGEIYNFKELKGQLEKKGHHFTTLSDTEIILHGFEEWNTNCVDKFHGMFAFAVYNRKKGSIFISRDRCGEKPVYYCYQDGQLCFASEIQALLKILEEIPSPDYESIYLYLRLGYIPSPRSFFKGIKKLEAGSSIEFEEGKLKKWSYYKPVLKQNDESPTETDLCDELDAAIRNAVKKMMISDVPLGAFLSGGLDSSLIVAMMAREGDAPKTFSISFNEESYDESKYANWVSQWIGTEHKHHRVSFNDFESSLTLMLSFGEPFADSSGIPMYYLAKTTREDVKVALSGDGADELFGGYRRYLAQDILRYYLAIPLKIRDQLIRKMLSHLADGDTYYAYSFVKSAKIFIERAEECRSGTPGLMLNSVFSHNDIMMLFPDFPDGRHLIEEYFDQINLKNIEALMYADRVLYLADDILVKVDRMSMRNSLEVRTPYLDPEVMAVSERIPIEMKIKGRNLKYLLKKVALRYLPLEIVNRKKHGFMVPMSNWIKASGEKEIRAKMPNLINLKALDQILIPHFKNKRDNSQKIFTLMILDCYL